MRTNVPDAIRALRLSRGWRQSDLADRAEVGRDTVSRAEHHELRGMRIESLQRLAEALGATLVVELRWRGADMDRLIDRNHAHLQSAAARRLATYGWQVHVEVAFNHYGDRGSCDVLAWHAATATLLLVEVKSRIGNLQDMLRQLDIKARLGPMLAAQIGLPRPRSVWRALVIAEGRSARRIIATHEALFGAFRARGHAAFRWLQAPDGEPGGLIWYEEPADSDARRTNPPKRVRNRRPAS